MVSVVAASASMSPDSPPSLLSPSGPHAPREEDGDNPPDMDCSAPGVCLSPAPQNPLSGLKVDRPQDWDYFMRREMQEIIPGLFLGPFAAALPKNVENLKAKNISEIVCVRSVISTGETNEGFFIKPRMPNQFNYLTLNISDSVTENIIPFFDQFYDWVSDRLSRNLSVLVHGNTGMSRSAALVISFVMRHFDYTSEEAISFVQRKRFCLFLNDGFKAQLREYEPIWKANQRKSEEHASEHETSLKRSFSQTAL